MQDDARELKSSVDLVEFIKGKGVKLRRQGKSFIGLCPFHEEKVPSFSVEPEKGLWHCFGCDKGGDLFTFMKEFEGLTFAQAVKQLKPPAPAPGVNAQEILNRVVEHYHQTFFEDARGLEYLKDQRGIFSKEIFKTFKIGFANGSLFRVLPRSGEVITVLKELGILSKSGKEFFHHRVLFPISDENGQVVEIYARSINEKEKNPHLYLKGPHKGVFNWQSAKRSKEILLTEGIIDALSLYEAGFKDVVPLYGTNGLTPDHLELFKKYAVKKIFFVFDNDTAGQTAVTATAQKLSFLKCFTIALPEKDANEFFLKHDAGEFEKLLSFAEPVEVQEIEEPVKKEFYEDGFTLTISDLLYRVKLIPSFDERLRATIKTQYGDKVFLDTLDLYSHRARQGVINQLARRFYLSKDRVEEHLFLIAEEAERLEDVLAEGKSGQGKEEASIMTEDEKKEALAFLTSPRLVEELLGDLEGLGYVGEDSNKLLAYLIGISRKLERPLSGIISSTSGAGKSHLAELIEELTPPEEVILFSRLSPQALGYMEKDYLKRKLLVIEERRGSEAADYSIRTLQTRRKLTQGVVMKDPSSGRMHTKTYTVEGPIAYLETTTNGAVNPENSTRCFELYLDESKVQTGKVQESQRISRTIVGLEQGEKGQRVREKHHNAQRLLKPLKVVIPYAPLLDFPSEWLRTRRDNERFLCLIEAICFIHQHQREIKQAKVNGETIDYIEANVKDYRLAYDLAKEVLAHTLCDLRKNTKELLEEITIMVKERASECNREAHDLTFSRREVREYTRWSDWKVRDCMVQLVDLEYLKIMSGCQGKLCTYQLSESVPYYEFSLQGLTSPQDLEEKLQSLNN